MATTIAIPNCLLHSQSTQRMPSQPLSKIGAQDHSSASLPCMGFARSSLQPTQTTTLDSSQTGLLDEFLFSPRPYMEDPVTLFTNPAQSAVSQRVSSANTNSAGSQVACRSGPAPDPRSTGSPTATAGISMSQLAIPSLDAQSCPPPSPGLVPRAAGIGSMSVPRPILVPATTAAAAAAATAAGALSPSPPQMQPVLSRNRLASPSNQTNPRDSRCTTPVSNHSMSPSHSRELPILAQGPLCLGGMDVPLGVRVPSAGRGALKPSSQGGARGGGGGGTASPLTSSRPTSRNSSAGGLFPATAAPSPSASITMQSSVPKLPRLRPAPTKASTFNLGSMPAGRPALGVGLARSRLMASALAHDVGPLNEGSSERSGRGSCDSRTRETCRSYSLDGSEPLSAHHGLETAERNDWVAWHMDHRQRLEKQHELRDAAMADSGRSLPDSMLQTLLSTDLSDVTDALLTTLAPSEGLTPRPIHTPIQHAPAQGLGPTSPTMSGRSASNSGRFAGLGAPKAPHRAADTLSLAMMMRQKQQAGALSGPPPSGRHLAATAGGAPAPYPAPPRVPRVAGSGNSSPLTRLPGRLMSSSQGPNLMVVGADSLFLEMTDNSTTA